jgi:leucyl aminopeptidase
MIELSTLTGAVVVALAYSYAGLFCNNDKLAEKLVKTGERCQENLWRMPLHKDYLDMMKGESCDLKNTGGPHGGSCTAAAYLSQFVDEGVEWAHIDVAGTTGIFPSKDATGYGVQLLFDHYNTL